MASVTDMEAQLLLNAATNRADAEAALRRRVPAPNVVAIAAIAAGQFVVVGFAAMHAGDLFRFLIGGIAGAGLFVAVAAYGEVRKLRVRVDALVALQGRPS